MAENELNGRKPSSADESGMTRWPPLSPLQQRFFSQFPGSVVVPEGQPADDTSAEIAFVGRDGKFGYANALRGGYPENGNHLFEIVTFYTNDEYALYAERLRLSLAAFSLRHHLHPIKKGGAWELTCALKARFIRDRWLASDVPVVWVDADATIEANPDLFARIDADFAIYKWWGWQFASGTLYFGKTDLAKQLLDRWVARCEADPATWDQVHLHSAWCEVCASAPLRTVWLPRGYCQIFDAPACGPTVIKHWQASRKLKAEGRTTGLPELAPTAVGKEMRRANRLWHDQETARHMLSAGKTADDGFPSPRSILEVLKNDLPPARPVLDLEFGMQPLVECFGASEYVGVSSVPDFLVKARQAWPTHLFRIWDRGLSLPDAPVVLCRHRPEDMSVEESFPEIIKARKFVAILSREPVLTDTMSRIASSSGFRTTTKVVDGFIYYIFSVEG